LSYGTSQTPPREDGAHSAYLRAVRAHPLLLGMIVLVAVATSVAWLSVRTAKYQATAQLLVTPVSNDGSYSGLPVITDSSSDPARTLQTAATVIQSPAAAAAAAKTLGAGWNPISVGTAVEVQPRGESDIIAITGTATSPRAARNVANAYARGALAAHANALQTQASTEVAQLQARAGVSTSQIELTITSRVGPQAPASKLVAVVQNRNPQAVVLSKQW